MNIIVVTLPGGETGPPPPKAACEDPSSREQHNTLTARRQAVTIVAGELIPKVFALKNKEWVCIKLSPPMHLMSKITYPAVWVLEQSSSLLLDWSERRWRPHLDGHKQEVAEMQELRAVVALARTSRSVRSTSWPSVRGRSR